MKNKIISIHQPNYIPWLGYFYKIYQSDIFVFHDDAQFSDSGAHHFHYIKTPQGAFRLKIPIDKSNGRKINQIRLKDELGWKEKHLKNIAFNYKKAIYFEQIFTDFSEILLKDYHSLSLMNKDIIMFFCDKLSINTGFVLSSELNLNTTREEKIFDTCDRLDGKIYYSGTGAKAYQNEENFIKRDIELRYSAFKPFEYPQLWGKFQSNVSVIDYLMNCGYDWERIIENQKNREEE